MENNYKDTPIKMLVIIIIFSIGSFLEVNIPLFYGEKPDDISVASSIYGIVLCIGLYYRINIFRIVVIISLFIGIMFSIVSTFFIAFSGFSWISSIYILLEIIGISIGYWMFSYLLFGEGRELFLDSTQSLTNV